MTMSGTPNKNITTTMVVEKPKKELSLEDKKAALEKELEEKSAEKAKLDADIAEQKRKKAKQDADELAEKIRKTREEQDFLLEQSKEAGDKLKKLMAQTGTSSEEQKKWDFESNNLPQFDAPPPPEKSAAEQIQETVKEIKESQIAAGESEFNKNFGGVKSTYLFPASEIKGISDEQFLYDDPEPVGFWFKLKAALRKSLTSLQVIVMLLFLGLSWGGFKYYEWKIDKFNASLNSEELLTQKINAYNDSNIQRVFFEAGNIGVKVLMALVILFIISPMVVKYIVPFLDGKVNFSEDFINVQPWVRLVIVSVLFFSVLLFLGLMATVNTY